MKKYLLFIITLLAITSITFLTFSCDTIEPKVGQKILIEEIDVAVSEAYLRVQIEQGLIGQHVVIYRDNIIIMTYAANQLDTLIIDKELQENTNYQYKAILVDNDNRLCESQEINISTLQPTSQNFNWEIYKFGVPSTSELWDVDIIDVDNILAVGEIYLEDSLGQRDQEVYNLIHWNGNEWEPLRLQFYTFCGQQHIGSYPTRSIVSFSENDIWITSGSQITQYDGNDQINTACIPISVNQIRGAGTENMYAVGNMGGIVFYNNGLWQKIESGTKENIISVLGVKNNDLSNEYLYYTIPSENKLLRIKNKMEIENTGWEEEQMISDLWGMKDELLFGASNNGVYRKFGSKWEHLELESEHFFLSIDAQGLNDIVVCGINGAVSHYNGTNWKDFPELQSPSLSLRRVSIKENMVVMVGLDSSSAVIIQGKR